jgi:hypothetical protein
MIYKVFEGFEQEVAPSADRDGQTPWRGGPVNVTSPPLPSGH